MVSANWAQSRNDWVNTGQRRDTDSPQYSLILSIPYSHHLVFRSYSVHILPFSANVSISLSFSFLNASLLYFNQLCESSLKAATSPQVQNKEWLIYFFIKLIMHRLSFNKNFSQTGLWLALSSRHIWKGVSWLVDIKMQRWKRSSDSLQLRGVC